MTNSVSTVVVDNVLTGDGPITYIAENGIQVSFKAAAQLVGNGVSLKDYEPPKVTACGLLLFKADNDFHNNEQNICNFGKGGGFSAAD